MKITSCEKYSLVEDEKQKSIGVAVHEKERFIGKIVLYKCCKI